LGAGPALQRGERGDGVAAHPGREHPQQWARASGNRAAICAVMRPSAIALQHLGEVVPKPGAEPLPGQAAPGPVIKR
jgi:hypothetical protein